MANFKEGDTVFVQKSGTLMKGTVTQTKDHGGVGVQTEEHVFHFNTTGFDKRTIPGSTCRLHPYSEEAFETWERGVLFEKIRNFHFSTLDTPELKLIVNLMEESDSDQRKETAKVQRSYLTVVKTPND